MKLIKECVLPDKFENCSAWLGVKLDTKIGLYSTNGSSSSENPGGGLDFLKMSEL